MKRFLPKSINNPQGFTLVELLVVVSIIAILSVIGLAVFGQIQVRSRNARRIADIDAISKAYEINYDPDANPNQAYRSLTDTDFQSGKIPTPPETGGTYNYVIQSGSSYKVCAALEGGSACSNTDAGRCYCRTAAQGGGIATGIAVCTNLNGGVSAANCKINNTRAPGSSQIYINCPPANLVCTGSTANLGTFTFYTSKNATTAGDGVGSTPTAVQIFGQNAPAQTGFTFKTVTVEEHIP